MEAIGPRAGQSLQMALSGSCRPSLTAKGASHKEPDSLSPLPEMLPSSWQYGMCVTLPCMPALHLVPGQASDEDLLSCSHA